MKVHGFDNTVPQPDISRKIQKSIEQSSAVDGTGKMAGKNESLREFITPGSDPTKRIVSEKDIIELKANRAAAAGSEDSSHIADIKDSVELGKRSLDAVYTIKNIFGAATEMNDVSGNFKLTKVRQNIADGYYDSPEFVEKLAEKLIEKFYLSGEKN